MNPGLDPHLAARLQQTLGRSHAAIHAAVARALQARGARGALLDVGCGTGDLRQALGMPGSSYTGVDATRYAGMPDEYAFVAADLNQSPIPLPDASADIVVAVETIEHLENPRAFVRELVRLARPGGWIVVTTPNQRSVLSLAALVFKGHFAAFLDSSYPAHQTALLDTDLRRIAAENRLTDVAIEFTGAGRVALTGRLFPRWISRAWPRAFSDNLLLVARRPL